jgi:MoaA/NifB/PqqE/SkfB family radical SAM enzyme
MKRLYTESKIFHFEDKLRDLREDRVSPPVHIRLKPENRCNHDCWWCCYRSDSLLMSEKMDALERIPRDKMREITRDIVDMGVRAVTFSGGGEPLLYPWFKETARALLDGGLKIAVLTNGSPLSGETAELLARHASWVRVSMDGMDGPAYERSRRVSGREAERIIENLKAFAASPGRGCVLGVNYVVTRENHAETVPFLRRMKEIGVDHVKVCEAVVGTSFEENRAYVAGFISPLRESVREAKEELDDERFRVVDKLIDPDDGEQARSYQKGYRRCVFAECLTVIAADLNVYSCQDRAYTSAGLVGSLAGRSFRELWASAETRAALRAIDPSRDCRHHCVAHSKNLLLLDYLEARKDHLDFI